MKRKISLFASNACFIAAILLIGAIPARATFPGANGRISFVRVNPDIGGSKFYTANPDGSDVRLLTSLSGLSADWRADGKRVAFDFFDDDATSKLRPSIPMDPTRSRSLSGRAFMKYPPGLRPGRKSHSIIRRSCPMIRTLRLPFS